MNKYVIGFYYAREAFRTSCLSIVVRDLNNMTDSYEDISTDSWTNRDPETLWERAQFIGKVVSLNRNPDHRKIAWVKHKVFNSKEKALQTGKEIWAKAQTLYQENNKSKFLEELEI